MEENEPKKWPPRSFETEDLDYGPSWASIVFLGVACAIALVVLVLLLAIHT